MEPLDTSTQKETNGLSSTAQQTLRSTVNWMKFISIAGFVMVGLFVIISFYIMSAIPTYGIIVGAVYLIIAAVFGLINLYLFQYGNGVKKYLSSQNSLDLEGAFAKQKKMYVTAGVVLIIYLAVILLAVIGGGAALFSSLGGGRGF